MSFGLGFRNGAEMQSETTDTVRTGNKGNRLESDDDIFGFPSVDADSFLSAA